MEWLMEASVLKGKKLYMSQVFEEDGRVIPVTVIGVDEALGEDLLGKLVTVIGTSKGKGFTGVMKKWGFHGQQATRGQSNKPRAPGAIGSQTPGKVFKGKKMAGKHGNKKVTIRGLKIVKVAPEEKFVMVSGPVPGPKKGSLVLKVS